LQGADEVQFDAAMTRDQRRPFGLGLLHTVLAEHALAGGDDRLDHFGAEPLRYRNERYSSRIAASVAAGTPDLGAHRSKPIRSAHGFRFVNAPGNESNFSFGAKAAFTRFY
jgi:hypothetical protein